MTDTITRFRLRTSGGNEVEIAPSHLVVAGYTGRDAAAVRHHIAELAAIGVPHPASIPEFYQLDVACLTTSAQIEVAGRATSGEVEPVLIRDNGRYYLTVGSDHTDRDLERHGIKASKAACPKPIAQTAIDLGTDPTSAPWDDITARSWVDDHPYQEGTLAQMLPIGEVLAGWDRLGAGGISLVLFGGTMPLLDGTFRYGRTWRLRLDVPGHDPLEFTYLVSVRSN